MDPLPPQGDQVAPVNLANLASTESQQQQSQYAFSPKLGNLVDDPAQPYGIANAKIGELEEQKHSVQQPSHQPQQQPQAQSKTENESYAQLNPPQIELHQPQQQQPQQQGQVSASGKFKMASLVDRVRLAQKQEQQQEQEQQQQLQPPQILLADDHSAKGAHPHRHLGLGFVTSRDSSDEGQGKNAVKQCFQGRERRRAMLQLLTQQTRSLALNHFKPIQ